ncbi:MAG: hypothetical protein U0441_30210 [Polyangiaceae bacterium]
MSRRSSRANAAHLWLPHVPKDHEPETTAQHAQATSIEPPHEPIAVKATLDASLSPPRVERHQHDAPRHAPEHAPREPEPVRKHAATPDAARLDTTSEPQRPTKERVRIIGPDEGWPFFFPVAESLLVKPAHVKVEIGADDPETWPFRIPGLAVNVAGALVEDVF